MSQSILTEQLSANNAMLTESVSKSGDLYLNGILMQAEVRNGNGRIYRINELSEQVKDVQTRISAGFSVLGELNHPDVLSVNLANVSHSIAEMKIVKNDAIGRLKILRTPSGNIARALIDGGVKLGVSSRGSGSVNESGEVAGFSFVTMDLVYQPSAPDAYPDVIQEALGSNKLTSLAEAVIHDQKAQVFLAKEIQKFISSLKLVK